MRHYRARPGLLLAIALLTLASLTLGQGRSDAAQPGEAVVAWHVTLAPTWFDPSTAPPQITPFGMLYAIHDAMVRPLPGQKMGNEPRRVVAREPRRAHLRVQAAPRPQVPQRRSGHRRGREVQLRALQGRGRQGAPDAGPAGRRRRPPHGPLPAEGAVAGLHDLLRHHRHRGRDRRARRNTSRRSATRAFASTRSAPARTSS